MSRIAAVVAVGDVMLDVELEAVVPGLRRHAPVLVRAGGSAVNAARAARDVGASAAVVGRVGEDAAGKTIATELDRAGVRTLLTRDPSRPTGVTVSATDQRATVADRGANAGFAAADVPDRLDAGALLVSGYLLLHDDTAGGARAALERAETEWLAVDAASAERVARVGPERFFDLAAPANAVLADAASAAALAGGEPEDAARRLGTRYRLAAVTAGASGAFVCVEGRIASARPTATSPRSSVGSGDAFAGALLGQLARGVEPDAAVRAASECASRWAAAPAPAPGSFV
jgi:ribokinase